MSEETAFTIPLNHRVRLKDDRADVYQRAFGGSEGWIRRQQTDPVGGFPMVYVQWDKEHWTYNGENDLWTFEDHFEPVIEKSQVQKNREEEIRRQAKQERTPEQPSPAEPESEREERPERLPAPTAARDFVENITDHMKREQDGRMSRDDEFMERMTAAFEAASESEAFFCIAVQRQKMPTPEGEVVLIPMIFGDSRTPEAELLIEAQLSDIASSAHQSMVIREVSRIMQGKAQQPEDE